MALHYTTVLARGRTIVQEWESFRRAGWLRMAGTVFSRGEGVDFFISLK